MHPSGKWLYASNRGNDTIAVFAVEPGKGTLRPLANVPTGGKEPRHFAIDPAGNFLLAENQHSDNIVTFRIDPRDPATLLQQATSRTCLHPFAWPSALRRDKKLFRAESTATYVEYELESRVW